MNKNMHLNIFVHDFEDKYTFTFLNFSDSANSPDDWLIRTFKRQIFNPFSARRLNFKNFFSSVLKTKNTAHRRPLQKHMEVYESLME
jgi:hypothetical protein